MIVERKGNRDQIFKLTCYCCLVAKSRPPLCNALDWSTPCSSVLRYLLELLRFMSIELVMLSNHLILYCPILLLPLIFPSIVVFSNELVFHIRWPKYWSFSFSISPSNDYSRSVSFRIDWFDLLAVQGTLAESSPAPQFKCINALALSLLYGPTLTSVFDYWKTHSFDYSDLCWQSDVSTF